MSNKHTPGPWKRMYSTDENGKVCLAVWKESTVEGEIGSPICKISPIQTENDIDRANSKLIAAAPELLEALGFALALQKAQGIDETHKIFGENITQMQEVYRKVTEY